MSVESLALRLRTMLMFPVDIRQELLLVVLPGALLMAARAGGSATYD
jgi:hypothetical protein